MKTGDYLGGVIIIICCALLWYRTGELENHLNTLALATKKNVVTEELNYKEIGKRYQDVLYQIDILTEQLKERK